MLQSVAWERVYGGGRPTLLHNFILKWNSKLIIIIYQKFIINIKKFIIQVKKKYNFPNRKIFIKCEFIDNKFSPFYKIFFY